MAFIASPARNVQELFGLRTGLEQVSREIWVHTEHNAQCELTLPESKLIAFTLPEGSKSF